MVVKSDKTNPVVLSEELFTMCNLQEEPLLIQLKEGIEKCKNVFEQMNCFGVLKQEISKDMIFW